MPVCHWICVSSFHSINAQILTAIEPSSPPWSDSPSSFPSSTPSTRPGVVVQSTLGCLFPTPHHLALTEPLKQLRRSKPPHHVRMPINAPPLRQDGCSPPTLKQQRNQHRQVENRTLLGPRASNYRRYGGEVSQQGALHPI